MVDLCSAIMTAPMVCTQKNCHVSEKFVDKVRLRIVINGKVYAIVTFSRFSEIGP